MMLIQIYIFMHSSDAYTLIEKKNRREGWALDTVAEVLLSGNLHWSLSSAPNSSFQPTHTPAGSRRWLGRLGSCNPRGRLGLGSQVLTCLLTWEMDQ